ncbi:hypothetical protein ES708_30175 [subsurface metagenome]
MDAEQIGLFRVQAWLLVDELKLTDPDPYFLEGIGLRVADMAREIVVRREGTECSKTRGPMYG